MHVQVLRDLEVCLPVRPGEVPVYPGVTITITITITRYRCALGSGWSIPVELVIGPHQGISYMTDSAVQVTLVEMLKY